MGALTRRGKRNNLREVITSFEYVSQQLDWYRHHGGFHTFERCVVGPIDKISRFQNIWKRKRSVVGKDHSNMCLRGTRHIDSHTSWCPGCILSETETEEGAVVRRETSRIIGLEGLFEF